MTLTPPPPETGDAGIDKFHAAAKLFEGSLRNRSQREFYRKDLTRWQKLYSTLAGQRGPSSPASAHFARLAQTCAALLVEFGAEAQPRKRAPLAAALVPLTYPHFSKNITHRIHFVEGTGIRRQRAVEFSGYATDVFRQTSGRNRVLVSVGFNKDEVLLFTRLVEAIGDLARGDYEAAGFDIGYEPRPAGVLEGEAWSANPLDPSLPIARIWADNQIAMGYGLSARLLGDQWRGFEGAGLPHDMPRSDGNIFDPDPIWQRVLEHTEADRLDDALELVETVHGRDREVLFDEVIYLRYLTGSTLQAQDIRLLARKYAATSILADRLLEEFETFLEIIQAQFDLNPPVLQDLTRLRPDFGTGMLPQMRPASDWAGYRRYMAQFSNPGAQRGRLFSINIGAADMGASVFFAETFVAAENAFRRERAIPEIGRGWVSETALFDLVRSIWPSAVHQWRPPFLGFQSIDIHVPELSLAIEYQGLQHYEPVALFGGQEGLDLTRARDERKRLILQRHGVRLLEWRFDVPITRAALVSQLSSLNVEITDPKR
ncbi:hypothetical protein [Rhizobium brockwellii]|uniref:hypothetical protein n=1 Tax=Rhizobium brockwellii TaxID=3019932 RepID=UPI00067CBC35|nr:hypothetical protein [Rhizobium brockwellii]KPN22717.1 hypothetical protein KS05_32065 [Rhizobium brockwellii]QJX09965.1 hypothetical protein RLCC275e_33855 [Rhizobium brockwellii]